MRELIVMANVKVPATDARDSREIEDELSTKLREFLISAGYRSFIVAVGPKRLK